MQAVKLFLKDEQGQDLIEYTLLLAFLCLAVAAIFSTISGDITAIWTKTGTEMDKAKAAAQ